MFILVIIIMKEKIICGILNLFIIIAVLFVFTNYPQILWYDLVSCSKACNLNLQESCDNRQKMNNKGMY
ncbi:hypothetical protein BKL50_09500 [Rodentibacter pneumotropicus]|nr:hypothetical protein BKL50_09500 [Rodentibacter pneumotropicus]